MTVFTAQTTRLVLDDQVVALTGDELDLLVGALTDLELRAGASLAEQIAALRLAGGTIDLLPTEAEHDALGRALETLVGAGEAGPALARLDSNCEALRHA